MDSRFRPASAVLALIVLATPAPALAQVEPTADVSAGPRSPDGSDPALAQLVAEALANNPDVLAVAEQVAAAEARPAQARALPDPMVSVQYTNDAWAPSLGEMPMTTLAFMGSQTLPWPGKRELRTAIAQTDIVQVKQRLARARLTLAAAVQRAYWGLALARETLALLDEQREIWKSAEGVARGRYSVGQGTQQDVLRAQVEITRYEQRRAELEAELGVRAAELNRLLNRPADAPPVETQRLALRPLEDTDWAALAAEAEARSPELRGAGVTIEREQLAARLARKEFRPDLTVQAGYMNRGGLDPMWQAGVGINLPLFRDKRRAAAAEAEARGRSATRQVEGLRTLLRFRVQERVAQLRSAETLARLYADAVVPQARLAYEASIASYQAGRVPFLAVLEALSSFYADRASELRVTAAHERIKVALQEASLEATSEMPSAGGAAMASLAGAFGGGGAMGGATGSTTSAAGGAPSSSGMGSMGQ